MVIALVSMMHSIGSFAALFITAIPVQQDDGSANEHVRTVGWWRLCDRHRIPEGRIMLSVYFPTRPGYHGEQ